MISAILLAAGESKRMGRPKMLLPWGNLTVIEKVVTTFLEAGVEDILVVTGGAHGQLEKALSGYFVRKIYNQDFATGEMLSSLQLGLANMSEKTQAALIGLGDQPQVEVGSVRRVCEAYRKDKSPLIVPSFHRKRGHPWLAARSLWGEILALKPFQTPRDFLNKHAEDILYVNVHTPTILADLDTPEEYQQSRPE